jgi:hypothetical protein
MVNMTQVELGLDRVVPALGSTLSCLVLLAYGVIGRVANSSPARIWSEDSSSLCNTMHFTRVWQGD